MIWERASDSIKQTAPPEGSSAGACTSSSGWTTPAFYGQAYLHLGVDEHDHCDLQLKRHLEEVSKTARNIHAQLSEALRAVVSGFRLSEQDFRLTERFLRYGRSRKIHIICEGSVALFIVDELRLRTRKLVVKTDAGGMFVEMEHDLQLFEQLDVPVDESVSGALGGRSGGGQSRQVEPHSPGRHRQVEHCRALDLHLQLPVRLVSKEHTAFTSSLEAFDWYIEALF